MKKISLNRLQEMKASGEKIVAITCYDAPMSRAVNTAELDVILVGDSLGDTVQGHQSTISVTVADVAYHTQCVAKENTHTLLISDLPFLTYTCEADAMAAARQLMQAGAQVIKMEGGRHLAPIVAAMSERGIPVCCHIGLTPQFLHQLGGYRIQGRTIEQAETLREDAKILTQAGARLLVMEGMPRELAKTITAEIPIPTIGIGAGRDCDGQILIIYDVIGLSPRKLTFAKNFLAECSTPDIVAALCCYRDAVRANLFPDQKHEFN